MSGQGPVLVMAPMEGTAFEAWRPAREGYANCGPLWTDEWLLHSTALQVCQSRLSQLPGCCDRPATDELCLQEQDWAGSQPQFNPPTSRLLGPGEKLTFGVRMFLAPSLRDRDEALGAAGYAVAHAVPGAICCD